MPTNQLSKFHNILMGEDILERAHQALSNYQHQQMSMQQEVVAVMTPRPQLNEGLDGRAKKLLMDRLSGVMGNFKLRPNEFVCPHVFNNIVYIFYVFEGEDRVGYLGEPIDGFPSDLLVSQLRLLAKA